MFLLYHAYVYLEFLILACTIYILAPTFAKFCAYVVDESVVPHAQPMLQTAMQLQAKDITVPLLKEFFFPNAFFIAISSFF